MIARRLLAWWGITIVSWVHLVSHAPWQRDAHRNAYGDALSYWRMLEQPWAPVDNPFALRILTPWLVRTGHQVTGWSPDSVWLTLTFAVTLGACLLFFELLVRRLVLSTFTALLVTVLLASTYWYGPYAFGNPWLVDPLNNVVVVVALWLVLRPPSLMGATAFIALLVGASLNKETALLLMPLYPLAAFARSRRADRAVIAGAVGIVVAAVVYLSYRVWAVARLGGEYELGAAANGTLIDNVRFSLSSNGDSDQLALWSVFGALWVIWLYGLHQLYREHGIGHPLIVASVWLFGCCLAGRLVATDTQRIFVMMAPLVLGVVAVQLDRWRGSAHRLWLLVLGVLYISAQLGWADPAVWANVAALAVFAGLVTASSVTTAIPPMRPARPEHFQAPVTEQGRDRHDQPASMLRT